MEIDKKALGNRIKNIRVNEGDTLEKFSNKINTQSGDIIKSGKSNVSRWEKGENIPNDITLKAIADLGNISVSELLYGDLKQYIFKILHDDLIENGKLSFKIEEYVKLQNKDVENIPEEHIKTDIIQVKSDDFLRENIDQIIKYIKDYFLVDDIERLYNNESIIIDMAISFVENLIYNEENKIIFDENFNLSFLKNPTLEEVEEFQNETKYMFSCRISLEMTDYNLGNRDYVELDYVAHVTVNVHVTDSNNPNRYYVEGLYALQKGHYEAIYEYETFEIVKEHIINEVLKTDKLKDFNLIFDEMEELT